MRPVSILRWTKFGSGRQGTSDGGIFAGASDGASGSLHAAPDGQGMDRSICDIGIGLRPRRLSGRQYYI